MLLGKLCHFIPFSKSSKTYTFHGNSCLLSSAFTENRKGMRSATVKKILVGFFLPKNIK